MKRTLIVASIGLGAAAAFATTDVNWTGAVSDDFATAGNWNPQRVPGKGDMAQLKRTSSGTVTMPSGAYDTLASMRFSVENAGTTLTWDASGTTFRQIESDSATYNSEPFGFRLGTAHFFNMETYGDAAAVLNKRALSTIANGRLRVSVPADGSAAAMADFDAGSWNFYDPAGTGYATTVFKLGAMTADNDLRLTFHPGTSTRFPQMQLINNTASGKEMTLDFAGGTHEILAKFDLPSQYAWSDRDNTTTVSVRDGAKLTFGADAIVGCTAHASYGGKPHYGRTYRFRASGEGSKMTFSTKISHSTGGTLDFEVADGASVEVTGDFGMSRSSNVPGSLRVTDASLKTGSLTIGSNGADKSPAMFAATNATLNLGPYGAYWADARIKDSSWTGTYQQLGFGKNPSSVVLEGGSVNWGGSTYVGYEGFASLEFANVPTVKLAKLYVGANASSTAESGRMIVSNVPSFYATHSYFGRADVDVYNTDWTNEYQFQPGQDGADSTVTFHGGSLTVKQVNVEIAKNTAGTSTLRFCDGASFASPAGTVWLGYVAGAKGRVEVHDSTFDTKAHALYVGYLGPGEFVMDGGTATGSDVFVPVNAGGGRLIVSNGTFNATTQLRVGFGGEGLLEVTGGTVTTPQIFLGQNESSVAGTVPTIRQTGGLIEATTTASGLGVKVADNATRTCRLELDGGVFRARRFFGAAGTAKLSANGGTVRPIAAATDFIYDFDEAKLGEDGLTVDADYACTIAQNFADADDAKGKGLLRLSGPAEKTLSGAGSTVSRIEIAGGTAKVQPATAAARQASAFTVKGGAALSLVGGQTSLTVASLTLGDETSEGVLALDPGDAVEVTGSLNVISGAIALNGDFAVGGAYDFIRLSGDRSAELADDWSRMRVKSGGAEGRAYSFSVVYDSVPQKTVVKMSVAEAADLSDANWTGAQGATWSTPGSWNPVGKPGIQTRAVFDSATAPNAVTVDGVQPVAALLFSSARGYALNGGGLGLTDHPQGGIAVSAGSNVIASSLSAANLPVTVGSGAKLVADGAVKAATLAKDGPGRLVLGASANSLGAVTVSGGKLAAEEPGSLGSDGTAVTLGAAGLSLGGVEGVETHYPQKVTMANPGAADAVSFDVDGDVTMTAPTVTGGVTYKGGAGRLTWEVDANTTLAMSDGATGDWCPSTTSGAIVFDADGNIPSGTKLAGVNVGEGELCLRGTKPGLTVMMQKYVMVGFPGATKTVAPRFTVDGLYLNANASSKHFVLGPGFGGANTQVDDIYLNVTNGATLYCNTLYVLRYSNRPNLRAHVLADNGVIQSSYRTQANASWGKDVLGDFTFRNGSRFLVGSSLNLPYRANFAFDGSVFAKDASLNPAQITVAADVSSDGKSAGGEFVFRNGSTLYCDSILASDAQTKPTKLVFDGSEWIPGSGDFTFDFGQPELILLQVENAGLVLAPPAAKTWTVKDAITGTGGLVKRGAGTLVFSGMKSIGFTGVARVEAGVLTVRNGAAQDGVKFAVDAGAALDLDGGSLSVGALSGAGNVRNGTLSGVLAVSVADDGTVVGGVPVLDGSTVSFGRMAVDLGRTASDPFAAKGVPVVVAHYTGSAPSVAGWRVKGTGLRNVRGVFTVQDRNVIMTVEDSGMAILVR